MKTTTNDELERAALERDWLANLALYNDVSALASSRYPEPLNEDERAAYRLLPELIEDCRVSWGLIPPHACSVHYLLHVFPADHHA